MSVLVAQFNSRGGGGMRGDRDPVPGSPQQPSLKKSVVLFDVSNALDHPASRQGDSNEISLARSSPHQRKVKKRIPKQRVPDESSRADISTETQGDSIRHPAAAFGKASRCSAVFKERWLLS
mmetsp:Transcript_16056/g.33210  ORF Transcript_16056/g.33210 Transcript_16056/m.33210 type:complete len:122 (+) Transcript_16056:85-450(+)